ncbi:MAG: T9SS type A sorting domain-containing protein [Saprospiraceae bacterium]|nr:T9SS type A sorting domain-containing protein [Saprospiraceae bacterium]MCF8248278.1 T9SS type A sorting domain-containing protein [Saprospiraceae bacterium]MCF8279968.1 T9SS type A sorting domain-containing protein [Bacteroidales bacterium]MCF8309806.1 T9SS type A sorting domain-containing protein [Saprospiraceae bacterium]MCF8438863.1 T9SS type A sorting domain-containing protein [Saprospiraceae bacterium]
MKKLLQILMVLAILPTLSHAQITIQASEVNPLGVFAIQSRDTSVEAAISPGGTGMQTWDFSMLDNNSSDSLEFYNASETAYSSLFPGANLAATLDSIAVIYFEKNDNHLITFGTYGTFTLDPYTVTTALKYNPPQTIIKFPLEMNQSFAETVHSKVQVLGSEVNFPFDSVRAVTTTQRSVLVDAYGQLTSPIGTFDVLRSTETEISVDTIEYLNNGIWFPLQNTPPKTITFYNWWTNQFDLGFPVVQYKISPGIDTSMIWLNEFVSSTHDSKSYLNVNLSPNPTSNFLNVELPDGFSGQMEVFDLNGRKLLSQAALSSFENLNVQALPVGSFVLLLKDKRGKIAGFERFEIIR